jgi:hypothetical protein
MSKWRLDKKVDNGLYPNWRFWPITGEDDRHVAWVFGSESDAKLMVAAPQMAKALVAAREKLRCHGCRRSPKECATKCFQGDQRPVYDAATAALEKAGVKHA